MKIQKNISLKKYNTFGIDVMASEFIHITSVVNLQKILREKRNYFILGGGSNMLLTSNIKNPILYVNLKGIEVINEYQSTVYVSVNAGENWHQFVLWCLRNNFGGVENLSLIPGNVGTSPIQNIGAYGVEVKDTIHRVNAVEIKTRKIVSFKNSACEFGYRNSIFKNKAKGKYIITNVIFKLTKIKHQLKYSYGAIKTELEKKQLKKPSIIDISNAIIKIRTEKLPDPNKIGNSGSFFKNPVVNRNTFLKIQAKNKTMPFYKMETNYKIPAGWLIEQCGFKGKRFGNTGAHKNQALVLVNYGNATGIEVLNLAKKIQETVQKKFGITLEMEVNIF